MTDDLLTTFRSEMPMPDDETKQRTYERATSGRRRIVTRRRLVAVGAVVAAAGIAGGLSMTLGGGGGSKPPVTNGPNRPGGFMPLVPLSLTFNRDGQTLTSIDARANNTRYPSATLALEVQHSDASGSNIQSVFDETVAMTSTGSTGQDVTVSNWSGSLSPSDWNGGCQDGIYRVRTAVYAAGTSLAHPFTSGNASHFASGWFTCSGASAQGPTGATGTTGAAGPTGSSRP